MPKENATHYHTNTTISYWTIHAKFAAVLAIQQLSVPLGKRSSTQPISLGQMQPNPLSGCWNFIDVGDGNRYKIPCTCYVDYTTNPCVDQYYPNILVFSFLCYNRHRAMAVSVALAHGIERPRGDTGATSTTSFGSHSRHLSDEIRMERPILRRPLSGDQSDFPQRRREYQTRPDTHRRSLSNRSAYERPSQRDNHTSLRPNNYLNSNRDDRGQRGK